MNHYLHRYDSKQQVQVRWSSLNEHKESVADHGVVMQLTCLYLNETRKRGFETTSITCTSTFRATIHVVQNELLKD